MSRAPALRMTDNEVMSSRNQAGSSASSSTSSSRSLSLGVENQTSSCYHGGGGNNSIRSIDRNSSRIIDQDLHEETDSIEAASKGHSADDEDEEEIEEADLQEGFSSATSSPVKLPLQPCKPPSSSNNSRGGGGTQQQQQPHQVGVINKQLLALSADILFVYEKSTFEFFFKSTSDVPIYLLKVAEFQVELNFNNQLSDESDDSVFISSRVGVF